MVHAHKMVERYSQESVPNSIFAARADNQGRDHYALPGAVNPRLMKMVRDFPVYYWAHEAFVKGCTWTNGLERATIMKRFRQGLNPRGAVHFFDAPQSVPHSEMGMVPCIGLIRYGKDMITLLYVGEDFDWDNLSHSYFTYNVYFCNGSSFTDFYLAMARMIEAYAQTPLECEAVGVDLDRKRLRGVDRKTLKSYRSNPVRTVVLRKLVRKTTEKRKVAEELIDRAGRGNTISVQFDVRGHSREQWYPSEGKHRTIWVEGFTKGRGKSRQKKAVVNKVVDRPLSPPGSGIEGLLRDVMRQD